MQSFEFDILWKVNELFFFRKKTSKALITSDITAHVLPCTILMFLLWYLGRLSEKIQPNF